MIKNIILVSIIILGLSYSQVTRPLLMTSDLMQQNLHQRMEGNDVIQQIMVNYAKAQNKLPTKVITYVVSIPNEEQNIINHMRSNKSQFSNLLEIFGQNEKSYFSQNSIYDVQKMEKKLISEYNKQNTFFKNFTHSYEEMSFQNDHQSIQQQEISFLETVVVPFDSLIQLNSQILSDVTFLQQNQISYVIFMIFTPQKNQRKLSESSFVEVSEGQSRNTNNNNLQQVAQTLDKFYIDGKGLSGLLVCLLLILPITLIGVCSLGGIQTPSHFAKVPLIVGRES